MQPARTDIFFDRLIDVGRELGPASSMAFLLELQLDLLGRQQRLVTADQAGLRGARSWMRAEIVLELSEGQA